MTQDNKVKIEEYINDKVDYIIAPESNTSYINNIKVSFNGEDEKSGTIEIELAFNFEHAWLKFIYDWADIKLDETLWELYEDACYAVEEEFNLLYKDELKEKFGNFDINIL